MAGMPVVEALQGDPARLADPTARNRPLLALCIGDRYGIGPELVVALLAVQSGDVPARILVVGDPDVFMRAQRTVGTRLPLQEVASLAAAAATDAPIAFLPRPFAAGVEPLGRVAEPSGREILDTLHAMAQAAKHGHIQGLVYAPLNKQAMKLAGHPTGDEFDVLAEAMPGSGTAGVINVLGRIWTVRVTSHVPLRHVADLVTEEAILAATALLDRTFAAHHGRRPRMAIAGLNPHAGDGGSFGMEEIEVIGPAVARAAELGFAVEGPVPADTAYVQAARGRYDGIVTMFHDQGQIALKAVGFGEGITLSAGLRVPVTTPSHGTAYDIAGQGIGKLDGLRLALEVCGKLSLAGT